MALGVNSSGPLNLTSLTGSSSGDEEMSEAEEIDAFKTDNELWNRLLEGKKSIEEKLKSNPTGSEFFDTVQDVNEDVEEDTGLEINPAPSDPSDGSGSAGGNDPGSFQTNDALNLGLSQFNAKGWVNSGPSIDDLADSAGKTAGNVVNVPTSTKDLLGNVIPGYSGNSSGSNEGLGFMKKAFIGLAILILGPTLIKQLGDK